MSRVFRPAAPALATLTLAAAAWLLPSPAAAGDEKDKEAGYDPCEHSTQECLDYMAQRMKNSGWVGVELDPAEGGGLEVVRVIAGSPAEEAGILAGDVLQQINGMQVGLEDNPALEEAAKAWKPGVEVTWSMSRGGAPRDLEITLGRMPADVLARYIGQHMLRHADVTLSDDESGDGTEG